MFGHFFSPSTSYEKKNEVNYSIGQVYTDLIENVRFRYREEKQNVFAIAFGSARNRKQKPNERKNKNKINKFEVGIFFEFS